MPAACRMPLRPSLTSHTSGFLNNSINEELRKNGLPDATILDSPTIKEALQSLDLPEDNPVEKQTSAHKDEKGLSEGALAGIIVGTIVVVVALAAHFGYQSSRRASHTNLTQAGPAAPAAIETGPAAPAEIQLGFCEESAPSPALDALAARTGPSAPAAIAQTGPAAPADIQLSFCEESAPSPGSEAKTLAARTAQRLVVLQELLDNGVISQAEFDAQRSKIIGGI